MRSLILVCCLFISSNSVIAESSFDYQLEPRQISKNTYVLIGYKEDFSRTNGGNIVNTGFIITSEGIVVIDTGPSLRYGQQMRKAIKNISTIPIKKVLLTHHHPDHILGNQAFKDVPIYALPETVKLIKRDAPAFLDNSFRMVGDWMQDTEVVTEILPLDIEKERVGDHVLNYYAYSGHTESDLAVFDETTGVLFAGDLVFHNRALTTPHAKPDQWLAALEQLKTVNYSMVVPGHGEVANNHAPIEQTQDYLNWVEKTVADSVAEGKDMNEVLHTEIPSRFQNLGVLKHEFSRSVIHRYPVYEKEIFNLNN